MHFALKLILYVRNAITADDYKTIVSFVNFHFSGHLFSSKLA